MSRRPRKNAGLLDLALEAPWPFAAGLAAVIAFAEFVWLPHSTAFGPFLPIFVQSTRPFAQILILVFAGIAAFKLLRPLIAAREEKAPSSLPTEAKAKPSLRTVSAKPEPAVPNTEMPRHEAAPRLDRWSADVLRDIEWKRFEDLCLAFYRAKGIHAESTPLGPDGGVDVRLYQDEAAPDRCTAIVQCKAWGDRQVGVKPVRELRGVMAHEQLEKAFFMAPGGYTDEAKAFARENRITLLDGNLFLAMLKRLPSDESLRLLAFATEGEWTTPTCPRCGKKMLARASAKGRFWGCPGFPKCRQTMAMRANA
jgi:restriction system protein